jgi:hypothetical protein
MQERPQFVGQPMRVSNVELIQKSPLAVARRVTDDISVINPATPEFSDVQFDMRGRRDYRGLRTIMDMSGEFRAQYVLTNVFDEPISFFQCPHPQAAARDFCWRVVLKLQASAVGVQRMQGRAWSGTVSPQLGDVEISYQAASVKRVLTVAENGIWSKDCSHIPRSRASLMLRAVAERNWADFQHHSLGTKGLPRRISFSLASRKPRHMRHYHIC